MKRYILYLLIIPGLGYTSIEAQELVNGDFENFGSQNVNIYRRTSSINPGTCQNEGGTLSFFNSFTGEGRPLGFKTFDDFFFLNPPSFVTQVTEAEHVYSGNSALALNDPGFGFGVSVIGIFEIEELVQEALPSPYPFDALPVAITGFYKHNSGPSQTFDAGTCTENGPLEQETTFDGGFAVYALFTKYNVISGERDTIAFVNEVYDDVSEYTAFNAEIEIKMEDVMPDSMIFVLSNSPYFVSPNPIFFNAQSYVDEVEFVFCEPIDNTLSINARIISSNDENADSYQWIDCDNDNTPVEGATERTFSAEDNGNYAVIITNGSCSETSACTFVDINSCNSSSTQNVQACFEYTWLGNPYSETGTYTATLPNSLGCDSLLTLNLTIDTVNTAITRAGGTLTSQQANSTYQWLDCDNDDAPVNGATSSSFTPGNSGRYAVEITTADGCTRTTECVAVEVILGIEENTFGHNLAIYPNPSDGRINIDLAKTYPRVEVTVSDLPGKVHWTMTRNNMRQANLQLDVPPGAYLVTIQSSTGPTAHARMIIQ